MIKKLFILILLVNTIIIYLFFSYFYETKKVDQTVLNQVVDIKNRDDLINTYSIKVMENSPANE